MQQQAPSPSQTATNGTAIAPASDHQPPHQQMVAPPVMPQPGQFVWAVSNLESIPPGAVLINPQTGIALCTSKQTFLTVIVIVNCFELT